MRYSSPVAVENRIVKVQKRNRALVRFDESRIGDAILGALQSIGGARHDFLPGINEAVFQAHGSDTQIARFLSDTAVVCLNANPYHLISNFPPTIETIQDAVLHALRSHGFQKTADAYATHRWGRHWLREGALNETQFLGNGQTHASEIAAADWNRSHNCHTVAGLNSIVRSGRISHLIEASIARYEAELDAAADNVLARLNDGQPLRLLWITGPTSSGKTTTTVKLTQRLARHGLRFLMLNLDDYFWPLVEHPTDWINDRNYETPEALDIQLLNEHLRALLAGQTIEKPVYNFIEGRRVGSKSIRLEPDQILLLDCLHGLYPPMTEGIDASAQFRLFVEARNLLLEGDGTTNQFTRFNDVRLLRRMLRDLHHRNHSPLRTLLHWHYVRSGELFSILPLRGLADQVINAGFPFDLPLLQPFFTGPDGIWPAAAVLDLFPGFLDARIRHQRLEPLLAGIAGLTRQQVADTTLLPGDAVLREFVGGGSLSIPHNK